MALNTSDLHVGHVHEEVVVSDLRRTQIVQYAGASGDFNPLHTDEIAATRAGYPSVFAHGMLTMGLTGKMLTNYVGDGRLTQFGGRFTSQVFPGDTLTARATIERIRDEGAGKVVDMTLSTVNQKGEEVFSGTASAKVDP